MAALLTIVLASVFVCISAMDGEPQCSPFHYHEQLLERMVDVKYKMDALTKKVDNWEYSFVEEKLEKMEEKFKQLEDSLTERMKNQLSHLNDTVAGIVASLEKQKSNSKVAGHVCANCPDRWVTFKGSCYLFGVNGMHFTLAEDYCRQHEGHLVEVNDALENSFLRDYMTELKDADYWLGMTDETVEGTWTWFNSKTEANFTDWHPGEPDDYPNINEDCSAFGHSGQYHWIDVPCLSNRRPLCEKRNTFLEPVEIVG